MTESVGYASLQIIPSLRGMEASINRQLGGIMPAAGRQAGEQYGSGVSEGFGSRISGMSKYAKAAAAGTAFALGAAGVAAVKWGVGLAAANEQAQISFETMLGSASKAKTFLDQLRDFAATTPFEFPELQTAASSLISAGVEADKVIPIMTTLGDVTAGMGTGSEGIKRATVALQQMQAAGKITGEDLNQLRDAGIPVYDLLAAATGRAKTEVTQLAQAGKLGKADLDALMAGLESGKGLERFAGLMEKQSQSLSGLFSTLKDNLGQKLATGMEPLNAELKDMLPTITDLSGAAIDLGSKGLAAAIESGKDFARWASPMAADLKDRLVPILENLGDIAGDVLPDALGLTAGAVKGVYGAISPLLTVVEAGTGYLADHEEIVWGVAAAYAAWKLGGKAAELSDFAINGVGKATTYLRDMQGAIAGIAATQGVSNTTATLGVLRSTLTAPVSGATAVGGGLVGIAVGATVAIKSLERSAEHGKKAAQDFLDALNIDESSSSSMLKGIVAINDEVARLADEAGRSHWDRFKQRINPWDENTIDEANAKQKALSKTLAEYAKDLQKTYGAAELLGTSGDTIDAWVKKLDLNVDDLGPKRLAYSIGDAMNAAKSGTPETDKLTEAYKKMSDETANSTDKINAWKDALDVALGAPRNLFDTETAFKQGLESFTNTIKENSWGGFGLDSEAGRANRDALSGLVGNVQDLANAYADIGQNDKAAEAIRYGREQIEKAGEAAGISKDQVDAYLDQLGLTEGTWRSQVELLGDGEAGAKLDALQAKLNILSGTLTVAQVKVEIETIMAATPAGTTTTVGPIVIPGKAKMHGGIDHYAGGGLRPSMIGSGRNMVWWDEPQTGGEGYFPRFGAGPSRDADMRTVAGWYGGTYFAPGEMAKTSNQRPRRRLSRSQPTSVTVVAAGASAQSVSDSLLFGTLS